MSDRENNMISTDVWLLKDSDHETRISSDTESLSDTDSETNLQSFNSLSPLREADADSWSADGSLTDGIEPQCDYMSNHSLSVVGNRPPSQLFQLRGTSSSFSFRSQNIFSGLENVVTFDASHPRDTNLVDSESKHPPNPAPSLKKTDNRISSRNSDHFFCKEACYWEPPSGKQSKKAQLVPDYLLHPERWTKYYLEDVPETSNKKNTMVAFEFMDSLNKQRNKKSKVDLDESFTSCFKQESDNVSGKILFSKPLKPTSGKTDGVEMTEQEAPIVVRKQAKKMGLNPEGPGQVDLAHLDYGEMNEVEDMKAWWHEKDAEDPVKDGKQEITGQNVHESVVFHSGKKRNRMNIRMKCGKDSEDN